MRAAHQRVVEELRAHHERDIQERVDAHETAVQTHFLRCQRQMAERTEAHDKALSEARAETQRVLQCEENRHTRKVAATRAQHEQALKQCQEQHMTCMQTTKQHHQQEMAKCREEHQGELHKLEVLPATISEMRQDLAALQREGDTKDRLCDKLRQTCEDLTCKMEELRATIAEETAQLEELRLGRQWLERMTRERDGGMVTLVPMDADACGVMRCFVSALDSIPYLVAAIHFVTVAASRHDDEDETKAEDGVVCTVQVPCYYDDLKQVLRICQAEDSGPILAALDARTVEFLAVHEVFSSMDAIQSEDYCRKSQAYRKQAEAEADKSRLEELAMRSAAKRLQAVIKYERATETNANERELRRCKAVMDEATYQFQQAYSRVSTIAITTGISDGSNTYIHAQTSTGRTQQWPFGSIE